MSEIGNEKLDFFVPKLANIAKQMCNYNNFQIIVKDFNNFFIESILFHKSNAIFDHLNIIVVKLCGAPWSTRKNLNESFLFRLLDFCKGSKIAFSIFNYFELTFRWSRTKTCSPHIWDLYLFSEIAILHSLQLHREL